MDDKSKSETGSGLVKWTPEVAAKAQERLNDVLKAMWESEGLPFTRGDWHQE